MSLARSRTALPVALVVIFATIVAVLVSVTSAHAAATYTVNTTADNAPAGTECSGAAGDCSLRQALDKATSGDTVVVPANATPYSVTSQISIPSGVTINGGGAAGTTISGGGTSQIFEVPHLATVTITGVTLADGMNSDTGTDQAGSIDAENPPTTLTLDGVAIRNSHSAGGYGGAMELGGTVTIKHSRFTGNSASGGGGGGAIDFFAGSMVTISDSVFENNTHTGADGGAFIFEGTGQLTLSSSTFSGNSAPTSSGGAIIIGSGATSTITNTTFNGNSASTAGGAVRFGGSSLTLLNDTLAGNGAPAGGNLSVSAGSVHAQNTIFAAPGGGGTNCAGAVTSDGHNLEDNSSSSCGLSAGAGDVIGQNPALASLADNSSQVPTAGGPPQTMALPSTSPAVGAGDAAGCTTVGGVDERAFPRPGIPGSGCDIGAFETLPQVGSGTSVAASNTHPDFHQAVTLTAAIASARALPAAVPAPGGTVTFKDGTTVLGSAPVSSLHATFTTSALAAGTRQISATYSGDAVYGGSASGPLAVTAAPPPLRVTVAPPRPSIGRLRQSHKVWRLGNKRARVSRAIPIGTTFRFKLNTAAKLRLTFRRQVGRKKRAAGTLTFKSVRAGQRKLAFQGRLSGHRTLKPGRYTLVLTASNATGHSSRTIKFTIAAG